MSFASVKAQNYKGAYIRICQLISDVYNFYEDVLTTELLNEEESVYVKKVSDDMEESVLVASLNRLSIFLHKIYGKKAIIILDEYDTPMQEVE